ncbi:hypothetical protein KY290_001278 [Solanum tuberosum]|uniref:Uncharacterized protein n=1 Tax=Solanum tuberosum TaxID=4113 RepID=A0ABQ7WNZ4_SOLTU|nr:hypothetical protein KY290_001278 [Solanum tuberosum]
MYPSTFHMLIEGQSRVNLQIVLRLPQSVEHDVLAADKKVKDEMRKDLAVLKNKMDGLEVHVQDQLQATCSVGTDEFNTQLSELRAQIAKLVEKPVHVPTSVLPESLMNLFS